MMIQTTTPNYDDDDGTVTTTPNVGMFDSLMTKSLFQLFMMLD
jgi:hypothetical protein